MTAILSPLRRQCSLIYSVLFNFLCILKLPAGEQQNIFNSLTISRDQFSHQVYCLRISLSQPVDIVPKLSGQQAPELHNTPEMFQT